MSQDGAVISRARLQSRDLNFEKIGCVRSLSAIVMGLVLSSAASAQQTATPTTPASTASAGATVASAPAPAAATSKWTRSLAVQIALDTAELQKKDGFVSESQITSANILALGYKNSSTETLKLGLQFELNRVPESESAKSDRERITASGPATAKNPNGAAFIDPYLAYEKRYEPIFGSTPFVVSYRLMPALAEYNTVGVNEKNRRLLGLRVVGTVPWQINKEVTLAYTIDPRVAIREKGQTFSWRNYLTAGYDFTEAMGVYYQAGFFHNFGRAGRTGMDEITRSAANGGWLGTSANAEVGLNYTVSKAVALTFAFGTDYGTADADPGRWDNAWNDSNTSYTLTGVVSF